MSDTYRNKPVYSLLEISKRLQQTIADNFSTTFWVKSEINKLNYYPHSGHAYPELLEKKADKTIAQMRSVMWRDDFDRVNALFMHTLKEPLKDGIKVMMLCTIQFDPAYGLSLRIHDIDPAYTLGDLELEKSNSIARLQALGLYDRNKTLALPLLPKRLAIISVESSKGYADFTQVIDQNPWQYQFFYMLFPALLQGEAAVKSIIWQMLRIKKIAHHFDAVAIIRGGGGDVGLSCYNHIDLASCIATFPLPVFTGIGHATNETVSEMVAWYNAITPTKLADFLIQKYHDFSVPLQTAERVVREQSTQILLEQEQALGNASKYVKSLAQSHLKTATHTFANVCTAFKSGSASICQASNADLQHQLKSLSKFSKRLQQDKSKDFQYLLKGFKNNSKRALQACQKQQHLLIQNSYSVANRALQNNKEDIHTIEKAVARLDEASTLKRGFSITRLNGHAINTIAQVKPGDHITSSFKDGHIISTIQTIHKHEPNT